MCVIQCALNVVDSSIWHTTPFEDLQPFLRCLLFCDIFDHAVNIGAMFYSDTVRGESRVLFPFRVTESVTQDTEQSIVASTEEDIAIEGLVAPVGDNGC